MPELDVEELISSVAERGRGLGVSRSPEEIRRLYSRGRMRRPRTRLMVPRLSVALVAALIVVVFFVPLPQLSLFRRIIGSHPATTPAGPGALVSTPFTPGDVALSAAGGGVFVLGTAPCGKHLCRAFWAGTGHSFQARVAPPGPTPKYPGDTGSTNELVFANDLDGYALESPWTADAASYVTTDGGFTWRRVSFGPGAGLVAVVAASGWFYGVLVHCVQASPTNATCGGYRLARSAPGSGTWSSIPIPGTARLRNLSIGLAASGGQVSLLVPNEAMGETLLASTRGASPLRVVSHESALISVQGGCDLTATSPSSLWAMCPTGMLVAWLHSGDGGLHFQRVWNPAGTLGATLDPVSGSLALRYTGLIPGKQGELELTEDGGGTWSAVSHLPFAPGIRVELAFSDAESGYALGSSSSSLAGQELLETSDGGHSWSKLQFGHSDASTVLVPDVVGQSESRAVRHLRASGLSPDVVDVSATPFRPGAVLSQSPASGTSVAPGTVVVLRVSRAS